MDKEKYHIDIFRELLQEKMENRRQKVGMYVYIHTNIHAYQDSCPLEGGVVNLGQGW